MSESVHHTIRPCCDLLLQQQHYTIAVSAFPGARLCHSLFSWHGIIVRQALASGSSSSSLDALPSFLPLSFGGNTGHDPHLLYTLSAIQILALCDELGRLDRDKTASYVASLQQADGSFAGDEWGEIDTRFSYCALSSLSLLGKLDEGLIDLDKATDYVSRCRNFDGGFGCIPGAESHAGQVFTCVGALAIGKALHKLDDLLLGWWLCERQCDSGGLNGRPEKQADVCYSWWILSALSILGKVDWIDKTKLVSFILACQDTEDGGISDRPANVADVFHAFFGISGLSLLGFFEGKGDCYQNYRRIDPVYALPADLVERLNLSSQLLPPPPSSSS